MKTKQLRSICACVALALMLLPVGLLKAEDADVFRSLYATEYLAGRGYVSSYDTPRADAVNPAASALNQRITMDLSYAALFGDDGSVSGLEGHAVNLGASFPSKIGVFSFSTHYLNSNYGALSAENRFRINGGFAKELYPNISAGAGLDVAFGGDGFFGGLDLGVIHDAGPVSFMKNLRWALALQDFGYSTIPSAEPYTFLIGTRSLLVEKEGFDASIITELRLPGFQNAVLNIGGDIGVGKYLRIRSGSSLNLRQLLDGDPAQLIPSLGIAFRFTPDVSSLNDRGLNGSELISSLSAAPVSDGIWAAGAGFRVPLGVIDETPPEISIDIDGLLQDGKPVTPSVKGATDKDDASGKEEKEPKNSSWKKTGKLKRFIQSDSSTKGAEKQSPLKQQALPESNEELIAFMSPNNDGIKDDIVVPINIQDSRYIVRFRFVVIDDAGNEVKVIENKEKRIENQGFRGFFDRLLSVKEGINIPETVRWDGSDDSGSLVEDGTYRFFLEAFDDNGNRSRSDLYPILVDTQAPEIEIQSMDAGEKIFSPNEDGNKDTITIDQSGSRELLWTAEIIDSSDAVRKSFRWEDTSPEALVWEGRDDSGLLLEDGVYSYRISATDSAGNSNEASLTNIVKNTEPTPVSLSIDRSHFSPNGDGRADELQLYLDIPVQSGIRQWTVDIYGDGDEPLRTYRESKAPRELITFDGRDQSGRTLRPGRYRAELAVLYENGNNPQASSPDFSIDLSAPDADVQLADSVFSPDGDGNKDTITFYQDTSLEERWEGEIVRIDSDEEETVRRFSWVENPPATLIWNGTRDDGALADDGTYYYRLYATDRAENSGDSGRKSFTLDTSATEVILTAELSAFSPNGDGVKDRIALAPKLQQNEGIASFSIEIQNSDGDVVRTIEGRGSLNERYYWDGLDDRKGALSDGEYSARLSVVYEKGNRPQAVSRGFILDTVYPTADISVENALFSPDGDGRKDELVLRQSSSSEELWSGEILDAQGTVLRRSFWKGEAGLFRWDGREEAGNISADGRYTYRLSCEDAAGNRFEEQIDEIRIDTTPTRIFVTADSEALSPTGNGLYEEISFQTIVNNPDGIVSWSLELIRDGEFLEKRFSGEGNVPKSVVWDGKNSDGEYIEGLYRAQFSLEYEKGNHPVAETSEWLLDRSAPEISLLINPKPFSPDNDGVDDELFIDIATDDAGGISDWKLSIYDPEARLFKQYTGEGEPAERIIWDGKSDQGELVYAAMDYPYRFIVRDRFGNVSFTEGEIPVDVLLVREDGRLKIKIASIIFQPNKAELVEEDREVAERNRYVLDRIAEILKKYKNYQISVEGHAALINWNDPVKAQQEEEEELQPLSLARAQRVVDALSDRGIDEDRLDALGAGGTKPLVPHSDTENRWKNRRVEFILEKKR